MVSAPFTTRHRLTKEKPGSISAAGFIFKNRFDQKA
jgi:hypothetical protein